MSHMIQKQSYAKGLRVLTLVGLASCSGGSTTTPARDTLNTPQIDALRLIEPMQGSPSYQSLSQLGQATVTSFGVRLAEGINLYSQVLSSFEVGREFGSTDNYFRQYLAVAQLFFNRSVEITEAPLVWVSDLPLNATIQTAVGDVRLVDASVQQVALPHLAQIRYVQLELGQNMQGVAPEELPALSACLSMVGTGLQEQLRSYVTQGLQSTLLMP